MAKFRIIERSTCYRYCDVEIDGSFEDIENLYYQVNDEDWPYTSWEVGKDELIHLDEIVCLDTREHLLL